MENEKEEENKVIEIDSEVSMSGNKIIFRKLSETLQEFRMPFEKIDPNSIKMTYENELYILEGYINNQFNSLLSGKAFTIYSHEQRKIFGARTKLSSAKSSKIIDDINRMNKYCFLNKNEKNFIEACNVSLAYNGFSFKEESLYYCPTTIKTVIANFYKIKSWKDPKFKNYLGKSISRKTIVKTSIDKNSIISIRKTIELMRQAKLSDKRFFSVFKILTFEDSNKNNFYIFVHYLSINKLLIVAGLGLSMYKLPQNLNDVFMISPFESSSDFYLKLKKYLTRIVVENESSFVFKKSSINKKDIEDLFNCFDQGKKIVDEKIIAKICMYVFENSNKIKLYGTNNFFQQAENFDGHYGICFTYHRKDFFRKSLVKVVSSKDLSLMIDSSSRNDELSHIIYDDEVRNYFKRQKECLSNFMLPYSSFVQYKKDDDYYLFNEQEE